MRWIRKNTPIRKLLVYADTENPAFEEMDKDIKDALRKALFEEQFGVCAYCEQKLKITKTKIEHHCEQSICDGENGTQDRRLEYTNLLLVCMGRGGMKNESHCDTSKADSKRKKYLPMQINPTISNHILTISYSTNGRIRSSNELHDKELNKILNLNVSHLKEMRKKKWGSIYSKSRNKNGSFNKDRMEKILDDDLSKKDNHFTNDFPGMSEYMKAKFC